MNAIVPPSLIVRQGPAIAFEQVSLVLGRTQVLADIDLRIDAGTVHAIVGPNGGGKSSLIRCLLGQAPHAGTIRIDWPGAPGRVGYVPQALEFDRGLPMTVMDFLSALVANRPAFLSPKASAKAAILAALAEVGMEGKAYRRMGALSGGERQRVMMAQGLTPAPDLLVLDEPMAALDEAGAQAAPRSSGSSTISPPCGAWGTASPASAAPCCSMARRRRN
ncbi:metal ABC transporter ATP-binding protein [Shinella sp.]|uniref:metal ABC transporter ATP-binding protein n=1 Tax=Shinella sp. TaxID=1870904 RepID=UPI003F718FE8